VAQPQYTPVLPLERLAPRIDASGDCWEWTGHLTARGYGVLSIKINGKWCNRRAHRLVWIALCGPIPDDLTLDHLCRLRRCVNPDHLEPVTNRVNILRGQSIPALNARGTHCKWGHNNWRPLPNGGRECRSCRFFHDRNRQTERTTYERLVNDLMNGRWRQPPGAPNYYVSADGCIRNRRWETVNAATNAHGIRIVKIRVPEGQRRMRVDDLIASAFPELASDRDQAPGEREVE
jgi:hypothetical protein